MPTRINSNQILDGTVTRSDLNSTTVGSAVVRKIIQGGNVTLTSTGADAGTGDVTINVNSFPWSLITTKPSTLSGYGITDAATSTHNHEGLYAKLSGAAFFGEVAVNNALSLLTDANGGIAIGGRNNAATQPYIDFHTGHAANDYDVRVQVSGGIQNGGNGLANLAILAGNVTVNGTAVSLATHTHTYASLTSKPTTLAGFGLNTEIQTLNNGERSYTQSRLQNLVSNGFGSLGNNTNFSGFSFVLNDFVAGKGSFSLPAYFGNSVNDELIPVDPERSYRLRFYARSSTLVNGSNLGYAFTAAFDADGLGIDPGFYTYHPTTMTTLAQPLAVGDTVVYLNNVDNWGSLATPNTYIKIHSYTTAGGKVYGTQTYSRNVSLVNVFTAANVNATAKTVTMSTGWSKPNPVNGGVWPVGTPISLSVSGGTYQYFTDLVNTPVPSAWTPYSGVIGGQDFTGQLVSNKFPIGTAYVKIGFLANRSADGVPASGTAGNITLFSAITLTEQPFGILDSQISNVDWSKILSKPTTRAGYGITDAASSTHDHDATYIKISGNTSLGGSLQSTTDNTYFGIDTTGGSRLAFVKKAGGDPFIGVGSATRFTVRQSNQAAAGSAIATATFTTLFEAGSTALLYKTFDIWHAGNFTNLNQLTTRLFTDLQSRPTTLAGYGITNAVPNTGATGLTGAYQTVSDNTYIGADTSVSGIRMGMVKKSGAGPFMGVSSGENFQIKQSNLTEINSNIAAASFTTLLDVGSTIFKYKGSDIWHAGNSQIPTRNFADITNKPTTMEGYGISNVYNAENINKFLGYGGVNVPTTNMGKLYTNYLMANGRPLFFDDDFEIGLNEVNVYNNNGNNSVVHTREADPLAPNNSKFVLRITKSSVGANPGLGGFFQSVMTRPNQTYIQRFVAKIPVGYSVLGASNAFGDGATDYWATSQEGTGKWENYVIVRNSGQTGFFSSTGFIFLAGPDGPVEWFVASCNVYLANSSGTTRIDNNQIKNVSWSKVVDKPTSIVASTTLASIATHTPTGFYQAFDTSVAGGWPINGGEWFNLITATHNNTANYFALQLAAEFDSPDIYIRNTNNNGNATWRKLWHTGNLNVPASTTTTNSFTQQNDFDNGALLPVHPTNGTHNIVLSSNTASTVSSISFKDHFNGVGLALYFSGGSLFTTNGAVPYKVITTQDFSNVTTGLTVTGHQGLWSIDGYGIGLRFNTPSHGLMFPKNGATHSAFIGKTADNLLRFMGSTAENGSAGKLDAFTIDVSTGDTRQGGVAVATGGFSQTSSRAAKENFREVEFKGLDLIKATHIQHFTYISDHTHEERIGFIADDTPKELSGPEQDRFRLTDTIAVLIKAVQELSNEVEYLKAEVQRRN